MQWECVNTKQKRNWKTRVHSPEKCEFKAILWFIMAASCKRESQQMINRCFLHRNSDEWRRMTVCEWLAHSRFKYYFNSVSLKVRNSAIELMCTAKIDTQMPFAKWHEAGLQRTASCIYYSILVWFVYDKRGKSTFARRNVYSIFIIVF